jgi:hypothetical protein
MVSCNSFFLSQTLRIRLELFGEGERVACVGGEGTLTLALSQRERE